MSTKYNRNKVSIYIIWNWTLPIRLAISIMLIEGVAPIPNCILICPLVDISSWVVVFAFWNAWNCLYLVVDTFDILVSIMILINEVEVYHDYGVIIL